MESNEKLLWLVNAVLSSVKKTVENKITVYLDDNFYDEYYLNNEGNMPFSLWRDITNSFYNGIINSKDNRKHNKFLAIKLDRDTEISVFLNTETEIVQENYATEVKKRFLFPDKVKSYKYSIYKTNVKYMIRLNNRYLEITKDEYEAIIEKAMIFVEELNVSRGDVIIDREYEKFKKIL